MLLLLLQYQYNLVSAMALIFARVKTEEYIGINEMLWRTVQWFLKFFVFLENVFKIIFLF
jgi:hypothetical protein